MDEAQKRRAMMLGLGLDNKDGHIRISTGDNFRLFGGSEETHELMQETVIRINERLASKGRRLEDVSGQEFADIVLETGPAARPPQKEA